MMEHEVHGKLTGAGGDGGCVIGFYIPPKNLDALVEELYSEGYTVYNNLKLCENGLEIN